jgi:hypothetical protein
MQKYMVKKPSNTEGVLGSNSETFGDSCENLRILYPFKKSGSFTIINFKDFIGLNLIVKLFHCVCIAIFKTIMELIIMLENKYGEKI